ncbi:hypothetical protein HDU81_011437 [Chytriomyces hyalinus]|nr:hypothetical protein HDU81_011437 [Chytriomyces hyalinus]
MAVIAEKLATCFKCNVQAGNLDIVLVPAKVSSKPILENSSSNCQKVESVETLSWFESQATLLGNEVMVENDDLPVVIDTDVNDEETTTDWKSTAGQYSYWLYTDPLVSYCGRGTMGENSRCRGGLLTSEVACSHPAEEQAEFDVCGAALDTAHGLDEEAADLVTSRSVEVGDLPQESIAVVEQYSFSHLDAKVSFVLLTVKKQVIAAEVSWAKLKKHWCNAPGLLLSSLS